VLSKRLASVWLLLDERTRRIIAANEAIGLGYGGISKVRLACGLSRKAIAKGIHEIQNGIQPPEGKMRRPGAGRKSITEQDPSIVRALDQLIEPETIGDPESPLRWLC
jgi:hypothetical protein